MLILSRNIGEKIIIGGDIEVIVMGIYNGTVQIGIEASKEITVHREEIQKKIEFKELQKKCQITYKKSLLRKTA